MRKRKQLAVCLCRANCTLFVVWNIHIYFGIHKVIITTVRGEQNWFPQKLILKIACKIVMIIIYLKNNNNLLTVQVQPKAACHRAVVNFKCIGHVLHFSLWNEDSSINLL